MQYHKILLWAGRISGLLIAVFFLYYFFENGMPGIMQGNGQPLLWFLPFTIPTVAGYLLAWWKPLAGGRLMIAGAFLLMVYFLFFEDYRTGLLYAVPSILIGFCFLGAANRQVI